MERFFAHTFFGIASTLEALAHRVGDYSQINEPDRDFYRRTVEEMIASCEAVGLQFATMSLGNLREELLKPKVIYHDVAILTSHVQRNVTNDLARSLFLCVPTPKAEYFRKAELFGDLVEQSFPEAGYDITEAGSCLAAGHSTACVFHLMRVLEHGLRALAKDLKVVFPKKAKTPVELKTWGEIINAIEERIRALPRAKTLKGAERVEFYTTVAAQFRYFRDAWRNNVMHTRQIYDGHQAMSVLVHVREFMQHLATRLKA